MSNDGQDVQAEAVGEPAEPHDTFEKELKNLLNRHSLEGGSDTPDWVLADYLVACLAVFDSATKKRTGFYSVTAAPAAN